MISRFRVTSKVLWGALALAFAGAASGQTVMKIGTATINDNQHEWMKLFAAGMEKRAAGRIKVELYPAGQLGSIPRMVDGVQLGTIEAISLPPEFLVGVDKRAGILSMPGLFKDIAHCHKVMGDPEFRKAFFEFMAPKGVVAISGFCSSPQAFLTKRKIDKLDDLKGLKVRVLASDYEVQPMRAIGVNPTPMALGEVLTSLQSGVIDGVSSIPNVFLRLKMNSAAKFVTTTGTNFVTVMNFANKTWLDKLPADLRAIVMEEGRAAELALAPWNDKANANATEEWKQQGGTVSALPAADQERLIKTFVETGNKVMDAQPDVKPFYTQVLGISNRHR